MEAALLADGKNTSARTRTSIRGRGPVRTDAVGSTDGSRVRADGWGPRTEFASVQNPHRSKDFFCFLFIYFLKFFD
jgi:hypothetical protein